MTEVRWLNDIEQQAWQGLLVFVNRGLPNLERTFKEHDLLTVHFSVLASLSERPDRTLRLSELADMANLSQSRLTHRLRTLVERGYVSVQADPGDGRAKNATLTDRGTKKLESVAPCHVEDVRRLVFDHLDDAETAALATALGKFAAGLCDHERFQDCRAVAPEGHP